MGGFFYINLHPCVKWKKKKSMLIEQRNQM
nr:MAG TPA: hypothetical protein [Bacteriophage sp.]